MNKIIFLQVMVLFLTLSSCESCEEEEWTALPPETQTGANTFGCLVDGRLFVKGKNSLFSSPSLSAGYNRTTKKLFISCEGKNEMGHIYLTVFEPEENITTALEEAQLSKGIILGKEELENDITIIEMDIITYIGENTGEIILTKIDTINHIVSGRFQFRSQYIDKHPNTVLDDTIISVSNGRFDIKLNIID